MKIQYCSDLHLEFLMNNDYLQHNPIEPVGEILLLGGDICLLAKMHEHKYFFDYLSNNWKKVYWIPGNHEFYHGDISKFEQPHYENIRSNVFLVNNQVIKHEGVNIICSTLWSFIHQLNEWPIQRNVSDFMVIRNNGKRFMANDFNQLHLTDLSFIKNAVANNKHGKNIVLTHHVPTLVNYPPQYKGSPINDAFAVELYDYIFDSNIDYWIYGHHHANIPSFKIGNTTMITNQLGYVAHGENALFKRNAIIEI